MTAKPMKQNKRLKILYINATSALGGGPKQMYDLIKWLDYSRFQVIVACPNNGPYFQKLQVLGVKVIDISMYSLKLKILIELIKIVKKEKINLIHSHGKGAGIYSRPVGILSGVPVVHTFHGFHYKAYCRLFQQVYFWAERLLGYLTTIIINVSKGEQIEALRFKSLQLDKSVIIHNGIDPRIFDAITINSLHKKKELGIKKEIFLIGTIARINVQKGIEYLIKSLSILSYRIPNFKCLIIGDSLPSEENLKIHLLNLVREMNLQERILFTGYRQDIPELLKILDLYVSSSLWEGLPIALLEAMACRKAIVATDVIGNNEVVVDGETGFLVPPRDTKSLAEKIAQLLEDSDLRKKFGDMGRKRVELQFSVETMVRATEEVYTSVLGGRHDKSSTN